MTELKVNMTPETVDTPVPAPAQDSTDAVRKIEITLDANKNVSLSAVGEFKTYEFYGILITTLLDVFSANFTNNLIERLMSASKPAKASAEDEARLKKLKAEVSELIGKLG